MKKLFFGLSFAVLSSTAFNVDAAGLIDTTPLEASSKPVNIAIDENANRIYVADQNNKKIFIINGTNNSIIGTIALSGFLPPIKTDGSGVYKLGRTLPVKFQLIDVNGNFVSTAVAHLYVAKISNGVVGADEVPHSVSSVDTGNQFRYDFTDNQYIYNLSTDTLSLGSWQLKAILDSGQARTVVISIK